MKDRSLAVLGVCHPGLAGLPALGLAPSFRDLFEESGEQPGRLGDQLAPIRAVRARMAEEHRSRLEVSRKALEASRGLLLALAHVGKGLTASPKPTPSRMAQPLPQQASRGSASMSLSQWIVYFSAEMASIDPGLSESRIHRMARRLSTLARGVAPEEAAASMAAGMAAARLH